MGRIVNKHRTLNLKLLWLILIFIVFETGLHAASATQDKPYPTQKSLDDMMDSINRIRIINAGMYDGKAKKGEILLDITNSGEISSFMSLLSIREDDKAFGYCLCLGGPTIEFYKDKDLVATISLLHGRSIRWDKWRSDVVLKNNEKLLDWLAKYNITKPRQEYEEDINRENEMLRQYQKWLKAMPDVLMSRWGKIDWETPMEPSKETLEDLWSIVNSAYPKLSDLVLALLGWYGSGKGPWSEFPSYESAPEELLLHIDTREIVNTVITANLTNQQMEGTARYLSGWTFHKLKPKDKVLVPEELKQKILTYVKAQKDEDKIIRVQNFLFQ